MKTETDTVTLTEQWHLIEMKLAAPHIDLTFRRVKGDGGPTIVLRSQNQDKWRLGRTYTMTLTDARLKETP